MDYKDKGFVTIWKQIFFLKNLKIKK